VILPINRPAVKDAVFRLGTFLHRELYRRTGGRVASKLGQAEILLLTTTGRRTGRAHTTPLNYLADGDRFVVVASFGGDDRDPRWLKNLRANPEAIVQTGAESHRVWATVATPEEKARYWPRMVEMYRGYEAYQRKTSRDIPIVILTRQA
jgi:deazaflavin-dependent oxidoreductase (nitroreductase family)